VRAVLHRPEMNGSGQGPRELIAGAAVRGSLPRPLRVALYSIGALLWLSGALWLLLHYLLPQSTPFGPLPNPWEAPLMRVHGLVAVGGVFLIGWMTAAHVATRWTSDRKRRSGLALGSAALLLVCSGYALYYSTGAPYDAAALAHEVVGAFAPLAAFAHWWRSRARD
jgi:hypothetical protein